MPELPEVETTCRGIAPHIAGKRVKQVVIRQPKLRWPIPADLDLQISGRKLLKVARRGKYLLLSFHHGTLIIHLGMSGSLRILKAESPAGKHDHFDLQLSKGTLLRLRDPRRFGAVLWTEDPPSQHPLIAHLGPEPLEETFNASYLYGQGHRRRLAIKQLIMDSKIVVGVGNIYASESLFKSGIHPTRPSNRISEPRYAALVTAIKETLTAAIAQGGTTLRDFQREDGNPGYFAQQLQVYGKSGELCPRCDAPIRQRVIAQRSTFYCSACQR